MTLGDKIKQLREHKGYSQEELANLLKVHSVTISKWESGTQEPRAKKLNELAKIFNVSNEYLLDNTETMNKYAYEQDNSKKEDNKLGVGYWGNIVDNARKLAYIGNREDISAALFMLKMAVSSLDKAAAAAV